MINKTPPAVLITSAGRRVELVQIWQKSARKALGPKARVYANDLKPALSAACQVADQSFEICRCTDPGYPEQLLEQCLAHGVHLVIPTIDTELLALSEARNHFQAAGIQLVVSDSALIRQCKNKRLTAKLFKNLSIKTPTIYDPANLAFPCFMKPIEGSCSQGVKAVPSSGHLSPVDTSNPDNLFQELIPREWIEYTADLYYSEQGILMACVPRQRLEARGGEISKGITRKDQVWDFLKDHLAMLKGARGVITVQVFTDPSRDHVLGIEFNPRFGGGYPMSHASGVDYPAMLIREYLLGEAPEQIDCWKANLIMLRHDAMVYSKITDIAAIP
ncbi:ATP-grasp domain-containing protein [Vulcanococcus limneticus]|uniref:ATP-grasp domain-containing protein n=1 Tax=Vulcanococcus limneticus TaxID=2170428 RepID=UPI00398BDCA6